MNVLGFAGSLREASYNRRLLRAVGEMMPAEVTFDVFDLAAVPLFNADTESAGDPLPVAELKEAVRGASGLIIATPEYNGGLSAVTKNAIDWLSRPPRPKPLDGKRVAVMGASPGRFGTARAQMQLRVVLANCGAVVMVRPTVTVSGAAKVFADGGQVVDERTRETLGAFASAALSWFGASRP